MTWIRDSQGPFLGGLFAPFPDEALLCYLCYLWLTVSTSSTLIFTFPRNGLILTMAHLPDLAWRVGVFDSTEAKVVKI